eukprot:8108171-Pyramimonas_sp.AAC.1
MVNKRPSRHDNGRHNTRDKCDFQLPPDLARMGEDYAQLVPASSKPLVNATACSRFGNGILSSFQT